ncbi:hypothetical protein ACQEU5_24795 [Marinactinospora thermotolerans]|uniref:hypothetical protein n=1 Tax=Marinactinospora thermotolerans TaxID=531310 RepID=UPI003D8DDF71
MSTWTVRLATADDLDDVVRVLNEAGARLAERGLDQWGHNWMSHYRMAVMIDRHETFLVHDTTGHLDATVTLSEDPGPFWTPEERSERAIYLGKLARTDDAAPGVGEWVLKEWAPRWAAAQGYDVIRLDAWFTNRELHDYYRSRGWTYVRHEQVPGNRSGALFELRIRKQRDRRSAASADVR